MTNADDLARLVSRLSDALRDSHARSEQLAADVERLHAERDALRRAAQAYLKHLDAGSPGVVRNSAEQHLRALIEDRL